MAHSVQVRKQTSGDRHGHLGQPLLPGVYRLYCSASEVRHPSEVCHLQFMTILKSFYCPVMTYMYTLLLKEAIPFI